MPGCCVSWPSSPRQGIDVLVLPEKFNTAVTESDIDPKVRKNDENIYRTAENIQHLLHILFMTLGIIHFFEPGTCLSNTTG